MFLRHGKLFGECVRPSSLSSQYASVSVQLTLSLSHAQTSTHTLSPLNKQAKGVYFSTDACRPHYKADAGLGANVLLPLRLLSSFPVLFSHAVSAGYIHSYYAVASIRSAAFKHIRRNSGLWIVFRTTTMLGKVHFEGRKAKCEFFFLLSGLAEGIIWVCTFLHCCLSVFSFGCHVEPALKSRQTNSLRRVSDDEFGSFLDLLASFRDKSSK